ncbi:uncharacterized protein JCM6883_007236 [Sporobolomyces salmoneus]|uniref:uncharacterized protein n=1 Tax=Sporobolomyces salmoneus TaxID=183962 RepID=UPI00316B5B0A
MKGFKIVPSIFANLKDLSILSYRGGLNIVTDFLKHRYLPNLERLLLCDVTLTNPGEPLAIGQLPQLMETGPGGMPLFARGPPSEYGSLEGNLKGDLIDKLRFLISPSFDIFDKYPNLVHIAILTSRHFLRPSDRYAVVYISTRPTGRYEIVSIFAKLSEIATDFSNYSLEYLALPPSFEGRLHSFEGRLRDYETSILDNLEDLGVEIHYDGDLGGSIAPPSFTNYLTKKKEEEVSRNARMVD